MKIYFKEEQFPETIKWCKCNRSSALVHDIQYIPSDENKVVVGPSEEEQMDFETFWSEIEDYIFYITVSIQEQMDPNYLAFLEDFSGGDTNIVEQLFLKCFKIEGAEMFGEF